jgi:hypothetical protein
MTTPVRTEPTAASPYWAEAVNGHARFRAKIEAGTKLRESMLLMALGWLAREGKVTLVPGYRTLRVSLRDGEASTPQG